MDARRVAEPVAPPGARDWSVDDAYTRVTVHGVLDHAHETLVQAVTEQGPGFWVMTPLQTRTGTVLINRGFVPTDRKDPASRAQGQSAGPVRIVGLLRASEPGGAFLRHNAPADGRWYSRDVTAIADTRQLSGPVAPYFIDADATPNPGGFPVGGLTVVSFRNSHLTYALTWFGLCLLSLVGAVFVFRHRG